MQSAFWHRFAATAHSPIGKQPELYGIRLHREPTITFARNDLPFDDQTGTNHEQLGEGLRKALYNYMHGLGLDADLTSWFPHGAPATTVPKDLIRTALVAHRRSSGSSTRRSGSSGTT